MKISRKRIFTIIPHSQNHSAGSPCSLSIDRTSRSHTPSPRLASQHPQAKHSNSPSDSPLHRSQTHPASPDTPLHPPPTILGLLLPTPSALSNPPPPPPIPRHHTLKPQTSHRPPPSQALRHQQHTPTFLYAFSPSRDIDTRAGTCPSPGVDGGSSLGRGRERWWRA